MRLRIRRLTQEDLIPVGGLPALTVERTLADLVEIGTDLSLVAGAARDAARAGKLVARDRLASYLGPVAARRKSDGRALASDLLELAGVFILLDPRALRAALGVPDAGVREEWPARLDAI